MFYTNTNTTFCRRFTLAEKSVSNKSFVACTEVRVGNVAALGIPVTCIVFGFEAFVVICPDNNG